MFPPKGKLTYAISGGKAGDTVTITLKASCNNYKDFTITLNVTLTEKDNQQALKHYRRHHRGLRSDLAAWYQRRLRFRRCDLRCDQRHWRSYY